MSYIFFNYVVGSLAEGTNTVKRDYLSISYNKLIPILFREPVILFLDPAIFFLALLLHIYLSLLLSDFSIAMVKLLIVA